MLSFEEREEEWELVLRVRRSGGMGVPETMYLKISACRSSSCH